MKPLAVLAALPLSLALGLSSPINALADDSSAQNTTTAPPKAPSATLEAVFSRTGQALVFDGIRDQYVLVRSGDSLQGMRVTAIAPDQLVLSTAGTPRHHFVLPLSTRAVPASRASSTARPAPARPVAIPVKPASDGPLDPYAEPAPAEPAPGKPAPARAAPEPVAKAPAPAPGPTLAEERVSLRRAEFDAALSDFTALSKEIQVARRGKRVRIKELARGSFFHRMGLRAGDELLTVAGRRIDTIEAAADVYALLGSLDRFEMKLYRGQQRTRILVELKR